MWDDDVTASERPLLVVTFGLRPGESRRGQRLGYLDVDVQRAAELEAGPLTDLVATNPELLASAMRKAADWGPRPALPLARQPAPVRARRDRRPGLRDARPDHSSPSRTDPSAFVLMKAHLS